MTFWPRSTKIRFSIAEIGTTADCLGEEALAGFRFGGMCQISGWLSQMSHELFSRSGLIWNQCYC
jgi:hypothetical protein